MAHRRALRTACLAAVCLSVAALIGPVHDARAAEDDLVFVSVPDDGAVAVVDRSAVQTIGSIDVGGRPLALAVTPDGTRLLVVNYGLVRLQIVDTATRQVVANPRLLGGDADILDVAVSPDSERAYVASSGPGGVTVVDLDTATEDDLYRVPFTGVSAGVRSLCITPDGETVFVVDANARRLFAFDTWNREFDPTGLAIPAGAEDVAVSADGARGIVVGASEPVFFDVATGEIFATGTDRGTHVAVTVVGNVAYVANSGYSSVTSKAPAAGVSAPPADGQGAIDVYDMTTGALVDSVALPAGTYPTAIVARDATHVYPCMDDAGAGRLLLVDAAGGSAGASAAVGSVASGAVLWSASGEETPIVSFFLPTVVNLRLPGAGKDSLVTGGLFDDGDLPVDYSQPVTLDVGGFSRTFTLVPNKKHTAYSYKGEDIRLKVTPNLGGSSRGRFKLKIQKTTLQGLVAMDGPVEVHFHAAGLPDMAGTVVLENGRYRRARTRGSLVDPPFFAGVGRFKVAGDQQDSCVVRWGFCSGNATPEALSDVRIGIGSFDLTISGASFVKKNDTFVAKLEDGSRKITVTLDYGTELVRVVAQNVELGDLRAGDATDFVLDPGNGAGVFTNHVRLGGTTRKVFY